MCFSFTELGSAERAEVSKCRKTSQIFFSRHSRKSGNLGVTQGLKHFFCLKVREMERNRSPIIPLLGGLAVKCGARMLVIANACEAIQSILKAALDCRATLAMTHCCVYPKLKHTKCVPSKEGRALKAAGCVVFFNMLMAFSFFKRSSEASF